MIAFIRHYCYIANLFSQLPSNTNCDEFEERRTTPGKDAGGPPVWRTAVAFLSAFDDSYRSMISLINPCISCSKAGFVVLRMIPLPHTAYGLWAMAGTVCALRILSSRSRAIIAVMVMVMVTVMLNHSLFWLLCFPII